MEGASEQWAAYYQRLKEYQEACAHYQQQQQQQQYQWSAAHAFGFGAHGSVQVGVGGPRWTHQQCGQVVVQQPSCTLAAGASGAAAATDGTALSAGGIKGFHVRPPAAQAPAPAIAPIANADGGWPPALRKWVERAFGACRADAERACVERSLRATIEQCHRHGTLWSTDWNTRPLPERAERPQMWPLTQGGGSGARGRDLRHLEDARGFAGAGIDMRQDGAGGNKAVSKKRRAKKGGVSTRFGQHLDAQEAAKRVRRAGRFEVSGVPLDERAERWNTPQPTVGVDFETGDITLDYTVVGTSQTLEKKYLRLTSAPDPRTVRPESVLQAAVALVRQKYEAYGDERGQEQYIYLWEQMKSIRQDLTVQRIRNEFTVEVYEMHARICLEFDDQVEFNQCQAQLSQLYEEGLGSVSAQRELTAYNILFNVGKGAANNVGDLMLLLTSEDEGDVFIRFALKVRAAEALGDYCTLFRLYSDAPGHAGYVMDTFADRTRLEAVRVVLKAYAPTLPVATLTRILGFEGDDECVAFLEDHGCVISDRGAERANVDCKASRASLVDYSIAQRLEEERKEAQRKAEIVPIGSFS